MSKLDNSMLHVCMRVWVRYPCTVCVHMRVWVRYPHTACLHACLSQIPPYYVSACMSESDPPNAMMEKQGARRSKGLPKQRQQIPACLYYLAWLVLKEPHPARKHLLLVLIYSLLLSHYLGSFTWQHGFSYFQFPEKLSHHIWGYSASFVSSCKVFSIT